MEMAATYAFQTPQGGWRIVGTRVSLDSVVHAFHEGMDPVCIVRDFPTLTLEKVYGAIAFYLRNREEIDQYLKEVEEKWEKFRIERETADDPLRKRLVAALHERRKSGEKS